jgi:hypothetical protein
MASFSTAARLGTRPMALAETAGVQYVSVDINWADAGAGIGVGNVVQLCEVPAGFDIVDWRVISEDIDSNASPTVAFTLGSLDAARTALTTAYCAAGAINAGATGGMNVPAGATAVACFSESRASARVIGLIATAATATAALTGKRGSLILGLRAGLF